VKRVVVFGSGGGIGRPICKSFLSERYWVISVDLDLKRAWEALGCKGSNGEAFQCDATDPGAVQMLAEKIWSNGPVDAIVYSPGMVFTQDLCEMNWEKYRELMAINLDGAFYCASAFVALMLNNRYPGSFVFISSSAGKKGEAGATAYCASKFGLIGMVQSFAAETAKLGIRANVICPGNVDTPMLNLLAEQISDREDKPLEIVKQELLDESFSGRLVSPEEVSRSCVWLCSDDASGITGIALSVDAGMLLG